MARPPRLSNVLKEPVVFFCKDCEKIVDSRPIGRKFVYKCAKCGTNNVAFGTEKAIRGFYRVKEDDFKEPAKEMTKKEENVSDGSAAEKTDKKV